MACSVNHANLKVGSFCPACGSQVEAAPSWTPTETSTDVGAYVFDTTTWNSQPRPSSAPKLIGLISIAAALVLVVAGIALNKSGWDNMMNSINSISDNSSSSIFGSDSGSSGSSGDSSGSSGGSSGSSSGSSGSSSGSTGSSSDGSWVPSGYTTWSDDPSIAFEFDKVNSCQSDNGNGCFLVRVTTVGSCSEVSGSMDMEDSSGNVLNSVDASAGSVSVGHYVELEFDDPDGSATNGSITSLVCG